MLYNLIQISQGKETIVMTDSLPKVNNRVKVLRSSKRFNTTYKIKKAEEKTEKFKQPPKKSW